MSVLTALYNSYIYCEENNFVDRCENIKNETVLLPIYHSNKTSNGNDIIEVVLNKEGKIISAKYLEKEDVIIFPVTEDSIGRSSGIAPHLLADEISYLSKEEENKNLVYMKNLNEWIEYAKKNKIKSSLFMETIEKFFNNKNFIEDILKKCYEEKYISYSNFELKYLEKSEKKLDMKKIFLTFKIQNLYDDKKDYSVTNYKQLHEDYICYMLEKEKEKKENMCDISGLKMYCSSKHRGLFGMAKLISVSNNTETYIGRFKKGEEIISIGYETSQKIHNMLKYFLEHNKNSTYLGESSYLINWFSDDIENLENISVVRGISTDKIDEFEEMFGNIDVFKQQNSENIAKISELHNEKILKFLTGNYNNIGSNEKYYAMIIQKISNGRTSIKYFRQLKKSEFYERVSEWYDSISWKTYNFKSKKNIIKYPGIYEIIDYTYGTESEGIIKLEQKKYRRDLMESLLTVMIDGKKIPLNIVKKMYLNISNRQRYDKGWFRLVEVACSIFKKYYLDYFKKEVNMEMMKDRNFLYGRLLAVLERVEEVTFKKDEKRSTNAQKLWSAYVNNPGKVMNTLFSKTQPYREKLKNSEQGTSIFLEKIIQEILMELMKTENFENNKNKKLEEGFIFGYYYQRNEFFKPKNNDEE